MFLIIEHTDTKSVGNNCFPQNNLVIASRVSFTSDAKFRGASLLAQLVNNLSAVQETWVQSLGWEDPLEKGTASYLLQYSCLKNPTDRGVWQVAIHGVARVRHDFATKPPNHHHQSSVLILGTIS